MTLNLTPYDTGARAEPHVWAVGNGDTNRYGKVDFDGSESNTIATVWIEGTRDGTDVMHVQMGPGTPNKIIIHCGGEEPPEIEYHED